MTNIEAVRKWLRTYESLSSGRLGVDFLPEKAQTYSVDSVPGPEIVKRYLDGSAVKQVDSGFPGILRRFHRTERG